MKGQVRSILFQGVRAHYKALLVALVVLVVFSVAGAAALSNVRYSTISTPLINHEDSRYTTTEPPIASSTTDKLASGDVKDTSAQSWDRMVIRTATLQLTVNDVGASVGRLRSLASQHGGYVTSSETSQQGEYTYSTVSIQVPSQEFDQVMPLIERMDGLVVKVASESVTSSDVTEEYTDLQSQLRNLQATEGRMLALQAKADKMEDVLAIDHELRDVQGQIETIQGRINYLSKRSEMSTIMVTLWPESAPVANESAWQPLRVAEDAWNDSMNMLAGVAAGFIRVGVFLWWLILLALVGAFFVKRARRGTAGLPSK
jgi:hypothetical protein